MARLANVKGAFLVDPLRAAGLDGRRVLLVDDVMTSGASIFTAAEALRQAGAAQVTAVVLARTQLGLRTGSRATIQPCSISSSSNPKFRPIPAM